MPEMHYHLRWPDSSETECYSPSLVIRDHFSPGVEYPMAEFLRRIRAATAIASARVQVKYGMPCMRALRQLAAIESTAARFAEQPDARVRMVSFRGLNQ
jgi:uncharacterized repeat protein (TIGR04042 family)